MSYGSARADPSRSKFSGRHVTQKLVGRLAFAFCVFADEMVVSGAAAVQGRQVESRNRLRVCVTILAQGTLPFARKIKRYEVICFSSLTTVKRQYRSVRRIRIQVA